MKNLRLLSFLILLSLAACKKDASLVTSQMLIEGKWFITSHVSSVYTLGKRIDTANTTIFTTNDFIEYYGDSTGYKSSEASPSPSIKLFRYSLSGLNLIETDLNGSPGLHETVTTLTTNNLSYHYTVTTTDDNGQQYVEANTYTFKRQ